MARGVTDRRKNGSAASALPEAVVPTTGAAALSPDFPPDMHHAAPQLLAQVRTHFRSPVFHRLMPAAPLSGPSSLHGNARRDILGPELKSAEIVMSRAGMQPKRETSGHWRLVNLATGALLLSCCLAGWAAGAPLCLSCNAVPQDEVHP